MSESQAGVSKAHWAPPFWPWRECSCFRLDSAVKGQTQRHKALGPSSSLFTRRKSLPEVTGILLQPHWLYYSCLNQSLEKWLQFSQFALRWYSLHKVAEGPLSTQHGSVKTWTTSVFHQQKKAREHILGGLGASIC